MITAIFHYIECLEDVLWGYIGFPTILLLGLYLSIQSGWIQIRYFPAICRHFFRCLMKESNGAQKRSEKTESSPSSISPLRAFFASVGGCLGIGNIVAITTAVQIGGPGSIIWIWITAILGSIMKYAEVCVAMKTRQKNIGKEGEEGYTGGPMYFLKEAFTSTSLPSVLFCLFMSLYGVEIYQFSVVVDVGAAALQLDRWLLTIALIFLVIIAERGGIKRVGAISGFLVPIFIVAYIAMGLYVLCLNLSALPSVLYDVVTSACNPRAVEGAFIGTTLLGTISQGVRRGCYSSDVGVGYASIIHSQSSETVAERQASLLIFEVFMDTFIVCTMSLMVVLLTGVWKEPISSSQLVQIALSRYFPYTDYFMPLFLFLLGYTTIITYFSAGMKTIQHLLPKYGRAVYYMYAILAFSLFSFIDTQQAIAIMACVQFGLLILNALGIWKLRHLLTFDMRYILDRHASQTYENISASNAAAAMKPPTARP